MKWKSTLAKRLMADMIREVRAVIRKHRDLISPALGKTTAAVNMEFRRRMGYQEDGNKRIKKN